MSPATMAAVRRAFEGAQTYRLTRQLIDGEPNLKADTRMRVIDRVTGTGVYVVGHPYAVSRFERNYVWSIDGDMLTAVSPAAPNAVELQLTYELDPMPTDAETDRLRAVADFDHPFVVTGFGVTDDRNVPALAGVYAPECSVDVDADGQIIAGAEEFLFETLKAQGWEPVNGYSGQHGYRGPVMHASEFLGGRMADDTLARPGVYVIVAVECSGPDGSQEETPAGWMLLKRVTA